MAKIKGSKKDNVLTGTKKIDEIDGRAGHDSLLGDKGNDLLFGRAGNDTLDGSFGDDVMKGGGGNDHFISGKGKDKFIGGKGVDTVSYAPSKLGVVVSMLDGTGEAGALSDTFKGIENVDGSEFDDAIEGSNAANLLRGLGGNDFLEGGVGDDVVEGGDGNDTVNGDDGNDKLFGGVGNDKVNGGSGNDVVDGGDGDDTMNGGDGDDTFITGTGKDAFIGGAGVDSLSYATSKDGVSIDLATGKGKGGADGDTFSGIENVEGTGDSDALTGNGAANILRGGNGDDSLRGGGGNDQLHGGGDSDYLSGGAGADALFGGGGDDLAFYFEETAGVIVNLATGKGGGAAAGDTYSSIENVVGTDFGDVITGTGSDNLIYGAGGGDTQTGGGGKDSLGGGKGADTLDGGAGDDWLTPDEEDIAADAVIGGGGVDWVDYVRAASGVTVNLPDNQALGGAAGDTFSGVENVRGSAFDDILRPATDGYACGFEGKDTVIDAAGTEVLRGGEGEDTLGDNFAEDGLRDIFFLEPYMGRDTIFGFDQDTDLFWLSTEPGRAYPSFAALAFDAQGKPAAGRLIHDSDNNGVGNPTQTYAQLIFDTQTKILWYDEDGTGSEVDAVEVALLSGFTGTLKPSDFQAVGDEFFGSGGLILV